MEIPGTWGNGTDIIHSNKAVRTSSDMEGMKVRGGSRLVNSVLEKLGVEPVGMPVPAVPEGVAKGVIDGSTISWEVTTALKFPEPVGNYTEFTGNALYVLTFVLAMNKDRYDSLPEDLRQVVDGISGVGFSVFAGGVIEDSDAPARKFAMDHGNNVVTLSAEEAQVWKELSAPIYSE